MRLVVVADGQAPGAVEGTEVERVPVGDLLAVHPELHLAALVSECNVIALALDGGLLGEEGVLVAALARLAELEGLVLLLGVHVVDDELLAAVVAVVEDGRHVLVQELVQIEAHQDGEGGCEFLRVLHANI